MQAWPVTVYHTLRMLISLVPAGVRAIMLGMRRQSCLAMSLMTHACLWLHARHKGPD